MDFEFSTDQDFDALLKRFIESPDQRERINVLNYILIEA